MITYSALISACEKGTLPQRALQLFEAMLYQGLLPNVITYSALITACGNGALPQRALQLFEVMLRPGFLPNVVTHSVFSVPARRERCRREPCSSSGQCRKEAYCQT